MRVIRRTHNHEQMSELKAKETGKLAGAPQAGPDADRTVFAWRCFRQVQNGPPILDVLVSRLALPKLLPGEGGG